ncbi:nucleoside triphosphate pyrophosphohydrolase [Natranaerobius thermophilus]|uniref:Phosphoribosyl-ATP pyrophosphohydrolase n=1 Tax=Natranaerobius thermophilus (strain ATCC BAA-1301 / DSM 18059 / JW/NM-WN-LF) TaxID=457570 RepID=B2A7S1_NATTJ|nr:nucleoside triphosphate pyrophosphohydrolase [Natranaerobius thermophilus]ACB84373.1 conserved hypothetical protein [Natranaerobius thermophilus JW/NM-WN-LF]
MRIKYDKLIRDNIPKIIHNNGSKAVTYKLSNPEELKAKLLNKLQEEIDEYIESGEPEELADIMEVIKAITENIHEMNFEEIEKIRAKKEQERGGFDQGIVLSEVKEKN